MNTPTPVPFAAAESPYATPRFAGPIDVDLTANEGLLRVAFDSCFDPKLLRSYPDARALRAVLAERAGRSADEFLVTNGADDAIDRVCRAFLDASRDVVLPVPVFEMTERLARATQATIRPVPWPAAGFPLSAVLAACRPQTRLVVVTTPNNPTGQVVSAAEIRALAAGVPQAVVLVDLAYVDYAEADPGEELRGLSNVLVTRTFSKAWGMAGLRVGSIEGPARLVDACRVVGLPFSVSAPSLAFVERAVSDSNNALREHVARVCHERRGLIAEARTLGLETTDSHANFVFLRSERASWMRDGLCGLGIAVRAFPDRSGLTDALRVSCPDDAVAFERLQAGLRAVVRPEALLLDMDGVLVDVSDSYREAICQTAAQFGVALSHADVERGKSAGGAANDWELTRRLLAERGVERPLAEVTERFESLYQGDSERPGLWEKERLLPSVDTLRALRGRLPLGIVTGRPRSDALCFLESRGIAALFDTIVTMEDAPGKPSPEPVRRALDSLGVTRAWMLGDTPDDVAAARAAGVVPLGILPPGAGETTREALARAGAARVLDRFEQIEELLR